MSVLIVGSVALDSIKTPMGKVQNVLGGSATYASFAASLFTTPLLVAVVGDDFSEEHRQVFEKKGIDLAGFATADGKTFQWQGRYGYDMNAAETLGVQLNVFQHFNPELPDGWSDAPYAFLGNIDPELQLRVRQQLTRPKLVACDSMNYWIAGKRRQLLKVLKAADLLLLNDGEARQLTGEHHIGKMARALMRMGPTIVVVKKGEHGALLAFGQRFFSTPGYVVDEVYDPTGAGDSFAGGMIGYLASTHRITWESLKLSVIYGSALASLTIEDFGTTQLAKTTRGVLEQRVAALSRLTRW